MEGWPWKDKLLVFAFLFFITFGVIIFIVGVFRDDRGVAMLKEIQIDSLTLSYTKRIEGYPDRIFKQGAIKIKDTHTLEHISKTFRSVKIKRFMRVSVKTQDYIIHINTFDKTSQKEFGLRMHYCDEKYYFDVNSTNVQFRDDRLGEYIRNLLLKKKN